MIERKNLTINFSYQAALRGDFYLHTNQVNLNMDFDLLLWHLPIKNVLLMHFTLFVVRCQKNYTNVSKSTLFFPIPHNAKLV
jgi:hypothetical protein